VTLSPATTEGERVRFHTLNRKTGDRIRTQYVDAVSGKRVEDDDQAKAYERAEDDYLILEEDEPSGNGRCSALASLHGACGQTPCSSSVVRIAA
jgi:hypothetical protein